MSYVTVNCVICKKPFEAKVADRKRGWAKCCSKRCASIKRERKTGNYARFCALRDAAIKGEINTEYGSEFSNAHQFSNEEHDCNKD